MVLMGAHEFVARVADEDRAGDQFVTLAASLITETPTAYERHRMAAVHLDERSAVRAGVATVVDHPELAARQDCGGGHLCLLFSSPAGQLRARSAARHKYQLATLRYGRQRSPARASSWRVGSARLR